MLIDLVMSSLLSKPALEPFNEEAKRAYLNTIDKTIYWHGTGRLQYDKQVKILDVLEQIIKHGSTKPFKDVFDIRQGEMLSTSVARQRMYARIYSDMHAYKGAKLSQRYGSPRFWAYYFIMAINLHAIKELGLWNPKKLRRQHDEWRQQGQELWASKTTRHPGKAAGIFFNKGSDIAGNYPVLIGLKRAKYKEHQTASYVARYESRISGQIPVEAFTHLEVPKAKLNEVRRLLDKYDYRDLPIFALEQCERLHADMRFSRLVRQKKASNQRLSSHH